MFALRSLVRTATHNLNTAVAPKQLASHQAHHLSSARAYHRPRIDWKRTYGQSQARGYARQAFNYRRFQQTGNILRRWAAQPTFYYQIGGIAAVCGGYYVYHLEVVPVSGRRRFNVISPEREKWMGDQMYQETIQQYGRKILPAYSKEHQMVQRVLNRLIPHSGLANEEWEIHVIDEDQKNAFVIPGGKVFVFTGILDVTQDDDGLATVLGHEIAHNVAHHAAERASQSVVLLPFGIIAYLAFGVDPSLVRIATTLAFTYPGSRSQETEADHIGLLMMAEACYDPEAAVQLWGRMEKANQGEPPQFLSTHPSSHNRQGRMREWLPAAEVKRESGDCYALGPKVDEFRRHAADFQRW